MRFLFIFFCLFNKTFAKDIIYQTKDEIYKRHALIVEKYNKIQRINPRTVFTPVPTRPYARSQSFYQRDVCYDCQNAINTVQETTKENELKQGDIIKEVQNEKTSFTPEFLVTNLKVSGHGLTQDFFVMQYKNKYSFR